MGRNNYCIAGFHCTISFEEGQRNGSFLIPSFKPFLTECDASCEEKLFVIHVNDKLCPVGKNSREHIKTVDTGNGNTIVYSINNGGYQFIVKDVFGQNCCLLQTNSDFSNCTCALNGDRNMRTFGLNNALMLAFAFASSGKDTLLMHASTVRKDGWAYAFTAKSGTGKSTQVANWLSHIPQCDMVNDDNPIIRIENNTPYLYGSPWSGKTPCYRNIRVKLGAIVKINRAEKNYVEPVMPIQAFATLVSSCSTMKWDMQIYNNICRTITAIIETTPNYNLFCLPDKESAIICHKAISRQNG